MARDSYEAGLKSRRKMLGGPWCREKDPAYWRSSSFSIYAPAFAAACNTWSRNAFRSTLPVRPVGSSRPK